MADEVGFSGLEEFKAALRKLPKEMRKRELDKGLRRGAKIVQQNARALAPVNAGLLKSNIVIRAEKKRYLTDDARIKVGVLTRRGRKGKKQASPYYWRFLEFGTSRMAARPFLVPAFESSRYAVLNAIIKYYRDAIPRLAQKVRR